VKKEHMQLAVIGVGLPVLAFFIVAGLKPAAKQQPEAGGAAAVTAEAVIPAVSVDGRGRDKITALQLKRWENSWGRDPFLSMSDSAGTLNEFELKGISFARDKKGYAFINDQIVGVGDTMSGYQVSRIYKDRVMLTRGSQTFFLTFSENQ